MSHTYPLTISSPDGDLFHGDVFMLTVRGALGDLAILANHIPFITSIKPGKCKIELEDGTEKYGFAENGLLTVAPDGVNLLSASFHWEE